MTPKTAKFQTQIAISRDDQISQIYWLVPMGFHWLRAGRGFLTSFRSGLFELLETGRWLLGVRCPDAEMWREAQVLEERATVFIHGRSPGRQRAAEPCLCSRVRTRRQEGATCSRLTCYIFVFVVFVSVFVTIRDKGQHKFLWWKKISFLMKA